MKKTASTHPISTPIKRRSYELATTETAKAIENAVKQTEGITKLERTRYILNFTKEMLSYSSTASAPFYPFVGGVLAACSDGVKAYQNGVEVNSRRKELDNKEDQINTLHNSMIRELSKMLTLPEQFIINVPSPNNYSRSLRWGLVELKSSSLYLFLFAVAIGAIAKSTFGGMKQFSQNEQDLSSVAIGAGIMYFLIILANAQFLQTDYNIQNRMRDLNRWTIRIESITAKIERFKELSELCTISLTKEMKQEVVGLTIDNLSITQRQNYDANLVAIEKLIESLSTDVIERAKIKNAQQNVAGPSSFRS